MESSEFGVREAGGNRFRLAAMGLPYNQLAINICTDGKRGEGGRGEGREFNSLLSPAFCPLPSVF